MNVAQRLESKTFSIQAQTFVTWEGWVMKSKKEGELCSQMVLENECGFLPWCQHIFSNRPCFYNITHPCFLAGVTDKSSLRVTPHCDWVTSICLTWWVNCGLWVFSVDSIIGPTLTKAPYYPHAPIPYFTFLMFYIIHILKILHHLSSVTLFLLLFILIFSLQHSKRST